jgi:Bacterial protein of unknown function (DUF945)
VNKIVTIVIVVVAALIAAVAALPYWFGMQAESAYEAMLQKMTTGGEFIIGSNNFQRGWFESTADTTFTLVNLPMVSVSMLHRWMTTSSSSRCWRASKARYPSACRAGTSSCRP